MSDFFARHLAEEVSRQTAEELKAQQPEVDETTATTIGEAIFGGPDFVKGLWEDPAYQELQAKADAEAYREGGIK